MIDVAILYTRKKTGVLAALLLTLALFAVSMPAARADPGFTLEDFNTWYWVSSTRIQSVAVGDVDGDGSMEIVTGGRYLDGTRTHAQLCVWDGATLSLENEVSWYWTSHTYISSVSIGDVDGDGATEIVTGGHYWDGTRNRAQLCVWDGSTMTLEGLRTWYSGDGSLVNSVAVGDVDGDGSVEIVAGGKYYDGTRDRAQLLVWTGSSLALEVLKTWYWTSHTHILSVAVGDVDGDGSVEIVTGGFYHDGTRHHAQLCVWDSSLGLEDVRTWYWVSYTRIQSVAIADVDGDPAVEIVTGGRYYDGTRDVAQLCVWTGSSLALEAVTTWYWGDDTYIESVAVGDVDGDGETEIVTGGDYYDGTRDVAQLAVWKDAPLSLEGVKTWYWGDDTEIFSVAVGDVDGDAQVEIVTGGRYWGLPYVAQLCVWGFT